MLPALPTCTAAPVIHEAGHFTQLSFLHEADGRSRPILAFAEAKTETGA